MEKVALLLLLLLHYGNTQEDITFEHAPSPQNAVLGKKGLIECRVSGQPVPTVSWRFKGQKILSGGRYTYLPEGLEIQNVEENDNGTYTCRAEVASDGRLMEVPITLIVEFKPRFDPDHIKKFLSWPSRTHNMTCSALGEPEPVIDWYLHDLDRPIQNNYTFKVYNMGRNSVLQVRDRDEFQGWIYGNYQCKAANKHGQGTIVIALLKATIPGKPRACEVRDESPTMVTLMVQPPEYNGGTEIYGYRVWYESGSQDYRIGEKIKIENLRPSTNYIFGIRAINEVGVGPYLEFTHTTEAILSPYPINIISNPAGEFPYSYVIKWEKPMTGGLPIKWYEFRYRQVQVNETSGYPKPLEDWTKLIVQEDITSPIYSYTLNHLNPNAHYKAQVIACNDIGRSPPNHLFIFTTVDDSTLSTNEGTTSSSSSFKFQGLLLLQVIYMLF